jgi:KipI family sensor histidine kinase inhibitor
MSVSIGASLMSEPAALRILPCGDAALTVEFGETVDPHLNALVLGLDAALAEAHLHGVHETIPTYRSLYVTYDPVEVSFAALSAEVMALVARTGPKPASPRRWKVPVSYGGEFGFDLEEVAKGKGLTPDEVVRRHVAGDYRVYMLGYMPGYAYLGGLDQSIATPRRNEPRLVTPAGAVMIGGVQAGIQCLEAPSGWHILGRTPMRSYHPQRDPLFLLEPGDSVSFYEVSLDVWHEMDRAAAAGELVADLIITPEPHIVGAAS